MYICPWGKCTLPSPAAGSQLSYLERCFRDKMRLHSRSLAQCLGAWKVQTCALPSPLPRLSQCPLSLLPCPILGSRLIGVQYLHRHETSPGEIPPGDQASFLRSGHIIRHCSFLSSMPQPPAGFGSCHLAGADPGSQIWSHP